MAYRFCIYCGERVAPEGRVCPKCGKPVEPQFLAVATPPAVEYVDEAEEAPVEVAAEESPAVQTVVVEAPPAEVFKGDGVCPACGGAVHPQAVLCVHCGRTLRDVKTGKKL